MLNSRIPTWLLEMVTAKNTTNTLRCEDPVRRLQSLETVKVDIAQHQYTPQSSANDDNFLLVGLYLVDEPRSSSSTV